MVENSFFQSETEEETFWIRLMIRGESKILRRELLNSSRLPSILGSDKKEMYSCLSSISSIEQSGWRNQFFIIFLPPSLLVKFKSENNEFSLLFPIPVVEGWNS